MQQHNTRRTAQCYATVAAGCTLSGTCNGPDISPSNPVTYSIGTSDSPACYVRNFAFSPFAPAVLALSLASVALS